MRPNFLVFPWRTLKKRKNKTNKQKKNKQTNKTKQKTNKQTNEKAGIFQERSLKMCTVSVKMTRKGGMGYEA